MPAEQAIAGRKQEKAREEREKFVQCFTGA